MPYKFLLFDLDHTLLDFDAAEDVALTQLLKEEGVADIQAYKDYYVPMNKALWKDLEQKKISKQELVNTRFSRLFAHFGLEKDGTLLAQRYQFYLAQQGQTISGAHELLDSLIERDYELYAATNGITAIQTGRLAQSGLAPYFNQVFISEQLQTQKPDALFYEKRGDFPEVSRKLRLSGLGSGFVGLGAHGGGAPAAWRQNIDGAQDRKDPKGRGRILSAFILFRGGRKRGAELRCADPRPWLSGGAEDRLRGGRISDRGELWAQHRTAGSRPLCASLRGKLLP